jgi:putative Holliday junction resolvase
VRAIGMDYGSVTLGVSISDELKMIANPLETLRYENMEELLLKIDVFFDKYKIDEIVLGNPINLDGTVSTRSVETLKFRDILVKRYAVPVIMQDERLTTVIVNNMLIQNNTSRKNRKKVVDKLAATVILQSYLDRK